MKDKLFYGIEDIAISIPNLAANIPTLQDTAQFGPRYIDICLELTASFKRADNNS
jgi:hypothetical protein